MPAEAGWHPDQPTARLSRRHVAPDADDETSRPDPAPQQDPGTAVRRTGGRHGRSDTTETPVLGQTPEPAPGGEPVAAWSMIAPDAFRPESTVILPARPESQPDPDQPRRRARHAHPEAEQAAGAPRFEPPRFTVPTPADDPGVPRFEVSAPQRHLPDAGEQLFVAAPAPGYGDEELFTPADTGEHLFRPTTPGARFDPAEQLAQLQAAARDQQAEQDQPRRHPAVPEPPGRRHWWPSPDERQAADVRDPAIRRSRHADASAEAPPVDEQPAAEPFAAARRFAAERALPVTGTRPDRPARERHGAEPTGVRPGPAAGRPDPAPGPTGAYPGLAGGWAAPGPEPTGAGGWVQPTPAPAGADDQEPTGAYPGLAGGWAEPGPAAGAGWAEEHGEPTGAYPGLAGDRPERTAGRPENPAAGARDRTVARPGAGQRADARPADDGTAARPADDRTAENPVLGRGADRPAKLDAETVLAAVRDVPGVRAADLRTDEGGGRTLRLDVAEGMDTDEITAAAGHALRDRLGVDARLAVAAGGGYELDPVDTDPAEVEHRPVTTGAVESARRSGDRRAIIERIQVATAGAECAVEVCLTADGVRAVGRAGGPALDPYLLRVAALATADAVGVLAGGRARCAVEHVDIVTAGPCRVVVVVLVLVADERAERLVGSAVASGDVRQATVRATMSALNRRLGPLLDAVLAS